MISLQAFAESAYVYAVPATQDYVQSTVFTPLGFGPSYSSIFAFPPCTTNLRLVGTGRQSLATQAYALTVHFQEDQGFSVKTLHEWGMPYCLSMVPKKKKKNNNKEIETEMEGDGNVMTAVARNLFPRVLEITSPVVVVNVGCAEAVLRGSDVFAPGVVSFVGSFVAGQGVFVGVYLQPANGSTSTGGRTDGKSLFLCVGAGTAMMDRREIIRGRQNGVAVRMNWTPMAQPSKSLLSTMLDAAMDTRLKTGIAETSNFFLQNYSSMVAVDVLVQQFFSINIQRDGPLAFLDACAAPGGKTSLLLSLLHEKAQGLDFYLENNDNKSSDFVFPTTFTLTCCERSKARYTRLVELLELHFGKSIVKQVVRPFCGDVNKLQKTQRDGEVDSRWECEFHGILLDPPCTGMGLRPKLNSHVITPQGIRDSADYQRKLFDSCANMLRRTGTSVLVYSTCTITLDENEANVLWALNKYPFLRLARAKTNETRRLCLLASTNFSNGCRFLLEEEIQTAQRRNELLASQIALTGCGGTEETENPLMILRFMPGLSTMPDEDGVGFFLAVFLCHSHADEFSKHAEP
ncbi:nucleolar protein, putative [Trypanosoma cruzi marinkellei]|uniref:Nucleolar protein, putative n=1 Tax=Trypanosoma cruzi marinkellei TaxID=85056 RepID=K2MVN8_TRYCR|nr:nucleolar protein, putative [Trypanosoma cruzi marinkellei]